MSPKALLDVNVILDYLLERNGYEPARLIFRGGL